MFVLLVINSLLSDIAVNVSVPQQVEAGEEILVKVVLDKSDFDSFARFQQEVPAGLIPEPVNTASADFSFKNQKVKFIWLKLPSEEKITISYKLKVDQRLKGSFDLKGTFSYIANNERKLVKLSPKQVTINPSKSIEQNLIVDINDFKNLVAPTTLASVKNQVSCIRQVPSLINGTNEYEVTILINKGNKDKFAKIQEDIPDGFTAMPIDVKDGIFTFKDQVVKFLWMNMPADPFFTVSYKLVPDNNNIEKPQLKGAFSYIENDNTLSINITEQNVNLANASTEDLKTVISKIKPEVVESAYVGLPKNYSGKVKIEIAESALNAMRNDTRLTRMLKPESGVYYRVQIAAGHKPININRYFKKYNLDKEVRTEFHEGWRKYSVGSFFIYKEARDYRVQIWNTTTIDDAFVSAYNNGKRITVQEALMITNHQWYR